MGCKKLCGHEYPKTMSTLAQNSMKQIINIRRWSEPNQKVIELYDVLKYKYAPLKKKICSTQI